MLTQGANPCENLQCGPGQECDIDRYGIATCQCPPVCEPVMRPVCGDDGKTYHSECDMRKSGCEVQKLLIVNYRGACGKCSINYVFPIVYSQINSTHLTCNMRLASPS
ncbi:agrin [Trichonephila clavata]|uniref:Agrin n=1 Tax=Trichonephila clavata TaxID=2740835 RepID=A0A8X6HWS2_TRICU|nr:agrin [Trichonephila clavata]